ncbi:MAG: mandelate racemase/muconate lactonizing enzyme family protein, partial [Desulfobacterales bacterium]|nr:mandelate racemase/muconate lactonizing enzyme family protein [Desulfobacterales bacterium]
QQKKGTTTTIKELEFVGMGLLDLAGRLQNKPAVELLNLKHRKAVPGLYCILDKDIDKVRKEAEKSIEQNLSHHLKFKMYGDKDLDSKLLKTIAEVLGKNSVIISDPNRGYKNWKSLKELAGILSEFEKNGLYGIEDPAPLTIKQWVELQGMMEKLALIPDHPMRPSWEGIEKIDPAMGRIFNLHPSTMGSFTHTAQLANKVQAKGAKVMIGDDSLAGPACCAWQQIAIGAGAVWVEAIEKEEDSKDYMECLISSPTHKDGKGYYSLNPAPGFGVEIDTDRLKKISQLHIELI